MALSDFGNGLMYDPKTGEVVINGADGKEAYHYDPTAAGGGKTYYGGQEFTGRYNPLVLAQMGNTDLQKTYTDYLNTQKGVFDDYNSTGNYAGKQNRQDYKYWSGLTQNGLDNIAFNQAYSNVKGTLDPNVNSFFDGLKARAQTNPGSTNAVKALSAAITPPATPTAPQQPSQQQAPTMNGQPLREGAVFGSYIYKNGQIQMRDGFSDTSSAPQTQQPAAQPQAASAVPGFITNDPAMVQSVPGFITNDPAMVQSVPAPTQSPNQSTTPDYSGFLQTIHSQISPHLNTQKSNSNFNISAAPSNPYTSQPFSIGNTSLSTAPKSSTSSNVPLGPSGKGPAPTSTNQQTQGMATGQFGSK